MSQMETAGPEVYMSTSDLYAVWSSAVCWLTNGVALRSPNLPEKASAMKYSSLNCQDVHCVVECLSVNINREVMSRIALYLHVNYT